MKEYLSFYKTVQGGEGDRCNYPTRLDMYGCGCYHNCQYCYARSLLEFRGLWNPESPSVADRKKVLSKLNKIPDGTVLRLGGMTDPFQPCENDLKQNEWLIGELNDRGIDYLIVTKSADVIKCKTLDPDHAHIQVSITSTKGRSPPMFERASPPDERLNAVEWLVENGFDTQIRLSPYIPQYVDMNDILTSSCDKILVEFLRVNAFIERTFSSLDFSSWTEKYGNYKHLPLDVKLQYLSPFIGKKRVSVCEDHPEHYKYFKEHFNPNVDDCCDLTFEH